MRFYARYRQWAHCRSASYRKSCHGDLWKKELSMTKCDQSNWHCINTAILNLSEPRLAKITRNHTVATKSPRFGPLINHSRIISSILNLNKYWKLESCEFCPQWNEVRIASWAEIGWPAYKLVGLLANGVDRIRIVTPATIYKSSQVGRARWLCALTFINGTSTGIRISLHFPAGGCVCLWSANRYRSIRRWIWNARVEYAPFWLSIKVRWPQHSRHPCWEQWALRWYRKVQPSQHRFQGRQSICLW